MQYWEAVVHGEGCVRVELGEEDGDRAVTSTCGHLWWLRCPATAAVRLGMEESRSCCLSLLWLLRPVATNRWLQTSLLFIAFKARAQGPGVGGATLSLAAPGEIRPRPPGLWRCPWSQTFLTANRSPPPHHHHVVSPCVSSLNKDRSHGI